MIGLVWFREDLRIRDNKALYYAAKQCADGLIGIYIIDHSFLKKHDTAACRVDFILRGLKVLSAELKSLNIPLLIFEVKQTKAVTKILQKVIRQAKAQALFFNRQYEIDEKRRDEIVTQYFAAQQIKCFTYEDQVILPTNSVQTRQGSYFKIFTPYLRAWRRQLSENAALKLLLTPKKQSAMLLPPSEIPDNIKSYQSEISPQIWPAGEKHARRRLHNFINNKLFSYHKTRDFPAVNGTSQLSPYLAAGMISSRECFLAALKANHNQLDSGNQGAVIWMNELIWREFYKHLLVAAPRISMHKPFQIQTDKLPWKYNKKLFSAWCNGKTGIPIIDAAMRQLNAIGWMHNRLRMITASFLAKNLQLDWRLGEAYFMKHLIDGDLAANNGGWQWCASTGADSMPYFRVFNPYRQSKRFDPDGNFIRYFCPELKMLNAQQIHNPIQCDVSRLKYPKPIVDLEFSRQAFIANFRKFAYP